MITVDLLDVCENCPHLEATNTGFSNTTLPGQELYFHVLTCENIDKCRALLEHLKKEEKKNGNKEK